MRGVGDGARFYPIVAVLSCVLLQHSTVTVTSVSVQPSITCQLSTCRLRLTPIATGVERRVTSVNKASASSDACGAIVFVVVYALRHVIRWQREMHLDIIDNVNDLYMARAVLPIKLVFYITKVLIKKHSVFLLV